jgi:hypothetical protein
MPSTSTLTVESASPLGPPAWSSNAAERGVRPPGAATPDRRATPRRLVEPRS